MHTVFIAGSDTGIGKTRVTGVLAALLPEAGQTVQIIKPVETGVTEDSQGDAETAAAFARAAKAGSDGLGDRRFGDGTGVEIKAYTLRRYPEPLAPVAAAHRSGEMFDPEQLRAEINRLPGCDWRFIEGAGGLAVPLDQRGSDWADFAAALPGVHVVLVVPDRLGAINQARLTAHYARGKNLDCSLWLNENEPADSAVRATNREGLSSELPFRTFELRFGQTMPEYRGQAVNFYRSLPLSKVKSTPRETKGAASH